MVGIYAKVPIALVLAAGLRSSPKRSCPQHRPHRPQRCAAGDVVTLRDHLAVQQERSELRAESTGLPVEALFQASRRHSVATPHLALPVRETRSPVTGASRRSGRRGSNPRPSAWEADALPTELRPRAGDSSPRHRSSGSSEIAPPDADGTGRLGSRTPMSGGGCLRSPSHTRTRFTNERMPEVYAGAGVPSYTSMNRR